MSHLLVTCCYMFLLLVLLELFCIPDTSIVIYYLLVFLLSVSHVEKRKCLDKFRFVYHYQNRHAGKVVIV